MVSYISIVLFMWVLILGVLNEYFPGGPTKEERQVYRVY